MDISRIDRVSEKLHVLFEYINSLKEENIELKRKVYALEINLKQVKASAGPEGLKSKYSELVEERDRLMMERELVRGKVKSALDRLEELEGAEK